MNFIGTKPLDEKVIVGPCGFKGKCTCGQCREMTSGERVNLMVKGLKDMCRAMDVFIVGGGFSTSFSDIVPAVVSRGDGTPCHAPAVDQAGEGRRQPDHPDRPDGKRRQRHSLAGVGLVREMKPAVAQFRGTQGHGSFLAAFRTGKIRACSDLRRGRRRGRRLRIRAVRRFRGPRDLSKVPLKEKNLSPEETLICETQARMVVQVAKKDVDLILKTVRARRSPGRASARSTTTTRKSLNTGARPWP